MSYLFFIDRKDKTVLHPDCLKLCPELRVLDEKETLTIIMAHDYHSPFNQFPLEDRERKALLHVYDVQKSSDEFFKSEKIKIACECYRSLQYNPKIEQKRIYQEKIDRLNKFLIGAKDRESIDDILDNISKLQKYILAMDKEIFADTIEEGVVVGSAERSWLEKMQADKALYDSITKPRKLENKNG